MLKFRLFNRIKNAFSEPNQQAIFIFGFQKSGTSAIAGLLALYSGKSVTIDTRYFWEPYLNRLIHNEITVSAQISNFSYDFSKEIIKEPNLIYFFDDLKDIFELKQSIFIVRNPFDNIRSILNRLQLPGDCKNIDIADIPMPWRFLFGATKGQDYIRSLAKKWVWVNSRMDVINHPGCHLIKYEDFNSDKENTIATLARDLGLEKKHAITKELNKPFQPVGNSNTDIYAFFGPDNIRIIKETCGLWLEHYGYH